MYFRKWNVYWRVYKLKCEKAELETLNIYNSTHMLLSHEQFLIGSKKYQKLDHYTLSCWLI